jgi:outer membrane protein assembly factor BamA
MKFKNYPLGILLLFCFVPAALRGSVIVSDTTKVDSSKQLDMIDVINHIFSKHAKPEERKTEPNFSLSFIPAIGYTLSTGFVLDVNANFDFYTNKNLKKNLSYVDIEAFYDSKAQKNLYVQSSIWANNDNLRLVGDARFLIYPDDTYGLGGFTTDADDNKIHYNYLRFYETLLGKVVPHLFMGGGVNFDYHYNISEDGIPGRPATGFDQYGFTTTSTSSGLNFTTLYDTRPDPINPQSGTYANFVFRQNVTFLGSNTNWESAQLDYRRYFHFPAGSQNVLAIWNMDWFTFNGKAPYMDLPTTGSDTFNNLGRGYEIGRFRGQDLLYLETEYRYHITSNGFLGGVVFTNAQSYTEFPGGGFKRIIPAVGAGARIKINKQSNTNICIDYAYGFDNSKGFFVNLGEMF